jgi:hypothetical protein
MSPTTPKLADPGALIRGGKLPEKDFPVCVEPDLVAEYEQLVEMKAAAKDAGAGSLAGGATTELDEQIADVQKRMEAATVVLRLRALGRLRWKALKDQHPARKGEDGKPLPEDMFVGVNRESFFNALARETIVAPVLDAETLVLLLDEKLTDGQWEELCTIAWNMNEAKISVPLSSAASPSRKSTGRK